MGQISLLEGQAELPTPNSTKSYWHQQPSKRLLNHRTTERLPDEADVVIVGSGITGAFAAKQLVAGLDGQPRKTVVMLEAREACWGATGRNGGHCQPELYARKARVGRFELHTYEMLQKLIAENNVPCDWHTVGGVHSCTSKEIFDLYVERIRRLERTDPDLAAQIVLVDDPEELAKLRVPNAIGAFLQPMAAKLWPYKLVAWVLEDLLAKNSEHGSVLFNLQTNTPALRLQRCEDMWIVHTPRGQIAAKEVLLATNAYTSHLLPKLTGLVVPVRGQVCALEPPETVKTLEHSHVWITPNECDDYLIHRSGGGPLMLGGERLSAEAGEVGISRDDSVNPKIGNKLRHALHGAVKIQAPDTPDPPALPASWEWTGIMGYSLDGYPWVGRVPESAGGGDGLWIAAGYTGHGMPVAAQCAVRVVEMMLGKAGGEVEMPAEFLMSEERLEKARLSGPMKINVSAVDELKELLRDEDD